MTYVFFKNLTYNNVDFQFLWPYNAQSDNRVKDDTNANTGEHVLRLIAPLAVVLEGAEEGWVDGWKDGCLEGWLVGIEGLLVGWVDGWREGWVDGWLEGWVDGLLEGWVDGWLEGWVDGWLEGCLDGWLVGPAVVGAGVGVWPFDWCWHNINIIVANQKTFRRTIILKSGVTNEKD
jgi:hypothetical protein